MNWLTLKAKLWALGAVLLTVLAYVGNHKRVVNQRDKLKKKVVQAKVEIKTQKEINALDNTLSDNVSLRRIEARKEIDSGKAPENIKNPNDF